MIQEYLELEKEYEKLMEKQGVLTNLIKGQLIKGIKEHAQKNDITKYPVTIEQIDTFRFNIEAGVVSVRWMSNTLTRSWDMFWFELPLEVLE